MLVHARLGCSRCLGMCVWGVRSQARTAEATTRRCRGLAFGRLAPGSGRRSGAWVALAPSLPRREHLKLDTRHGTFGSHLVACEPPILARLPDCVPGVLRTAVRFWTSQSASKKLWHPGPIGPGPAQCAQHGQDSPPLYKAHAAFQSVLEALAKDGSSDDCLRLAGGSDREAGFDALAKCSTAPLPVPTPTHKAPVVVIAARP